MKNMRLAAATLVASSVIGGMALSGTALAEQPRGRAGNQNKQTQQTRKPVIKKTIRSLPNGYRVIHFGGVEYYLSNGSYYRRTHRDGDWIFVIQAPPVGFRTVLLPAGSIRLIFRDRVYHRHGSIYYLESSDDNGAVEYVIASPPIGVEIQSIPDEYDIITTESGPVFVSSGVYYKPTGYEVCESPEKILLDSLPDGCETIVVGNTTYYLHDKVYYLPFNDGSGIRYRVVDSPE